MLYNNDAHFSRFIRGEKKHLGERNAPPYFLAVATPVARVAVIVEITWFN